MIVAVLSNNYSRLNEEISDGLAGIVFGGTYDNRLGEILARESFTRVEVDPEALEAYAGSWRHAWGIPLELEIEGGDLVYRDPERGLRHRLIPVSDTRFVSPWQWARIDFERGSDGSVSDATMTWLDFPEKQWALERVDGDAE